MIALIAARSRNNVIGQGLRIPWHAKGEQQLFRRITLGNTLIMGRRTFESIGRALPGRDTVVLSHQAGFRAEGCHIAHDLPAALELAARLSGIPFIAGGGEIYRQALPLVEVIHLTTVDTWVEGDVYFPDFDLADFTLEVDTWYESNVNYRYQKLIRKH